MYEFKKITKVPLENLAPCENHKCNNYYNTTYKNADGYCKPCKIRRKDEQIKLKSNSKS